MSVPGQLELQGRLQLQHVQPLLAHVDHEEAVLRSVMHLLEQLPTDVLQDTAQREARQQIEKSLRQAEQLAHKRRLILTHIGRVAGIRADQVTFSRLIRRAAADAVSPLLAAQGRLQRIVRQLQCLSAVVAWVVHESQAINGVLLQELLGETVSHRYDAHGQRALQPSTIRFETRS